MKKMKKLIGLLVFVAAFCFGIVAASETAKADVFYDLKYGENYELPMWDDEHYLFETTLTSSGRININYIAEDNSDDTRINIIDDSGTEIWSRSKELEGSFKLPVDLKAGNYTIDIYTPGCIHDGGFVKFSYTDAKETYKEDALDTNDQVGAASYIKSIKNKTIKGQFAENDTVDYYEFKVKKATKVSFTFKSVLKNVDLHLFNEDLDYEVRRDIVSGTNKFSLVLPKGTYYMQFSNENYDAVTGNYTLQLKTSDLKKASFKSIKSSAKKTAKATWKKASGVDGYQIQIATNSKFTKGKKSYTTTKTSYTMKKLKSKKNYYVRIRTYTIAENGEKCYSDWSKAKKIKTK